MMGMDAFRRFLELKRACSLNLSAIYTTRTDAVCAYRTTVKGIVPERVSIIDSPNPGSLAYATLSRVAFRFSVNE